MLEKVVPNNYYRNIKTGDVYFVLAIAKDSENPQAMFVCYFREQEYWVRPLELFKQKFEEDSFKRTKQPLSIS